MTPSPPRCLLLGATGYTGRLAAREMVLRGMAPLLLGRDGQSLRQLVSELTEVAPAERLPSFEVVDLQRPASLQRLLHSPDDVLVTTVGPFARLGRVPVEAAVEAGCGYLDASEEPMFVREVFDEFGPRAAQTGARLLTGFGFQSVPGNLAAALLLRRYPGAGISRIDIGYFVAGGFTPSSGTIATSAQVALDPSHSLRSGRLTTERPGARSISFDVDGHSTAAVSIGGTEQYALPRLEPGLREVHTQAGWIGKWARPWSAAGALAGTRLQVPGVGAAVGAMVRTAIGGASATGPADHQRAKTRSVVIARGRDAEGGEVGRIRIEGPNPYDMTASLLAWGAQMLARRTEEGVGALGPADAFGLRPLHSGCLALGIADVG